MRKNIKNVLFTLILMCGFLVSAVSVFAVSGSTANLGFWQNGNYHTRSGNMQKNFTSYFIPTSNVSGTNKIKTTISTISLFGWSEKASHTQTFTVESLGRKISINWDANGKYNTGFEWKKTNGSLAQGGGQFVATIGHNDR